MVEVEEAGITVEEGGTTVDRPNGGVEEGAELGEVGGEEDGVEEEIPDSRRITKTSDTRVTSITRTTGTLVIGFNRTGLLEAEEVSSATIRGLLIIKIHIKEWGDMDQLVLALIATITKHLRLFNSVIQGKLCKLLGFFYTVQAPPSFNSSACNIEKLEMSLGMRLVMLFTFHDAIFVICSAQIRVDMEEWNKSSMWPLSCYAYFRETPCLPGFADVSPEELRWEAYQAKASGNSQQYLKSVSQLNDERLKIMHEFSNLTTDDIRDMVSESKHSIGLIIFFSHIIGTVHDLILSDMSIFV